MLSRDAEQRCRAAAFLLWVFGVLLIAGGLFTGMYYYEFRNPIWPDIVSRIYPYANYAVPMGVLGAFVIVAGGMVFIWRGRW